MDGGIAYTLRNGCEDDHEYVKTSWSHHLYSSDPYRGTNKFWLIAAERALIEKILKDDRTVFLVACDTRFEDQILGYVVGTRPNVLHWVHVKGEPNFRRQGIATGLMCEAFEDFKSSPIYATHWAPTVPHYRTKWKLTVSAGKLFDLG